MSTTIPANTKLRMDTHLLILGAPEPSGNGTSSRKIFANVAFLFLPLNGVVPNSISYIKMPSVHQSTALVCPQPLITSGAMYSSVPTNEFVLKFAMQLFVSIVGILFGVGLDVMPPVCGREALEPLAARRTAGAPPGSDCFDKSKSESIMWPDWCSRMSVEEYQHLIVTRLTSRARLNILSGFKSL